MTKKIIQAALIATGVLGLLNLPGYLEYSRTYRQAQEFSQQAHARQIESKVVSWSHDFTNPFTWGRGLPTFVAARKQQSDGNYLVLYSNFTDETKEMNKALVWADCGTKQMRLVTQGRYEDVLKASGYDILGNKLPTWEDTSYEALQAVMVQMAPTTTKQSLFFDIACRWEKYASL